MQRLLDGLQVLDLGHDPAARAARILGDLGAAVVRVVPGAAIPSRQRGAGVERRQGRARAGGRRQRAAGPAGRRRCRVRHAGLRRAACARSVGGAHAVWVRITPFGASGPRSGWRATDLGVMAASSANMYAHRAIPTARRSGAPNRLRTRTPGPKPRSPRSLRCGPSGRSSSTCRCRKSCSSPTWTTPARFPQTGFRGSRRGANIGRTREIWPTKDGFVSFGLRGGKARVPSLDSFRAHRRRGSHGADWNEFNQNTVTDEELRAIEDAHRQVLRVAHHAGAVRHRVRDEPHARARELHRAEIYAFRAARGPRLLRTGRRASSVPTFFRGGPVGRRRGRTRPPPTRRSFVAERAPQEPHTFEPSGKPWAGVNILEFGSGAAGPIATRYFAEQGATVLRVESKSRPDFLRVYALGPNNPHGLEAR